MNLVRNSYVIDCPGHERTIFTAESLRKLKWQICKHFKVSETEHVLLMEDGTELDDEEYFQTRPNLSLLVLVHRNQRDSFISSRARKLTSQLCQILSLNADTLTKQAQDLLPTSYLLNAIKNQNARETSTVEECLADSRCDHPEWFEELPKSKVSKKSVMKENCQLRIKNYFYDSKKEVGKNPAIQHLFEEMIEQLRNDNFNGYLFMRDNKRKLCTREGKFLCQGSYDQDSCKYFHETNPYESREKRILFGTWNLDHQVERKRCILPAIKKAAESIPAQNKLNTKYFYNMLFTMNNLRLVDFVCHKKKEHVGKLCNSKEFYIPVR